MNTPDSLTVDSQGAWNAPKLVPSILATWVGAALFGCAALVWSSMPGWWGFVLLAISVLGLTAWNWASVDRRRRASRAEVAWGWSVVLWLLTAALGMGSIMWSSDRSTWAWASGLVAWSVAALALIVSARWRWWGRRE